MTERGRDRVINISTSTIAAFIIFIGGEWAIGSRVNSSEINKKIDAKVEKIQYDIDRQNTEKRMDMIEKTVMESNLKYVEAISCIQTDIKWIRAAVDNDIKARRSK